MIFFPARGRKRKSREAGPAPGKKYFRQVPARVKVPEDSWLASQPPGDYADAFCLETPSGLAHTPEAILEALFRDGPAWPAGLLRLRRALARLAGLDSGGRKKPVRALRQGRACSMFTVPHRSDSEIVLCGGDKHLDFYVSILIRRVDVSGFPRLNNIVASTLVRFHNRLGRVYFRIIRPFHSLIVPAMLRRAVLTAGKTLPLSRLHAMSQTQAAMDAIDKRLLDIIQTGFPLASRPYAVLGEELGISEQEALDRVRALKQGRIIRRLGANFQSVKLGFRSTLCAAKVPADKLDSFVADVNALPGVTHNYLRDHPAYNVWFTLIGPCREDITATLDGIAARTGIPILNLPATRLYKIRVDFRHSGGGE